jgi:hypothetical protein
MSARLRAAAPPLTYAALATWYCWPLFASPDGLGLHDWDQHLFYYASAMTSMVEYGQPPFWNPWYCGGNVLWQNPQVPILSPVFPLALAVSLPLAMKINIVLHYWIGLVGMHALIESGLGVGARAVTMALAATAVFSGAVAMHLAVGHSVFLPALYLPLQLHFLIRAFRSGAVVDAIWTAVPLALMVWNGALHVVPMSIGGVGVCAGAAAVARRRVRPLAIGLIAGLLGLAFAAPKLVPVWRFVTSDRFVDTRTVIERPDAMSAEMILRAYLDRYQDRSLTFEGQRSGWHEYGNYIGGVLAASIAAGLIIALFVPGLPERWLGGALAAAALVFLALQAGELGPWAPASLAGHVPLFSSFRIPSRYTIGFVLFGTATAAWAWRAAVTAGPLGRSAGVLLTVVAAVGVLDVATATRGQLRGVFDQPPLDRGFDIGRGPTAPPEVDATASPYGPDSPMLRALMRDTAFFNCYESLQLQRTATGDAALVETDGRSRLFDVRFTPNRVDFAVATGPEPSVVRLNQNAAQGWTSSAGPIAAAGGAGMRATLEPGATGAFTFRFVPPGFWIGCAIAALGVVGAFAGRRFRLPDR